MHLLLCKEKDLIVKMLRIIDRVLILLMPKILMQLKTFVNHLNMVLVELVVLNSID